MNAVAAIVVTYNRCDLLSECIEKLKKSEYAVDILIIDNASTDQTEEVIRPFVNDSDVFYFNTGKNIGGAGGFNYGMKRAYEMGYEYFWLMDDDTMVKPDSLSVLMRTIEECGNEFGFMSSMALWLDNSLCEMNYHDICIEWGKEKKLLQKGILRISSATFVSFLTRREVIESVGLPIKEYFIWGDDTEYSLRISQRFPCYLSANSIVIHKMKENTATYDFYKLNDVERIERMRYSVRNDCCTFRRMGFKKFLIYSYGFWLSVIKVIVHKNPYKGKKLKVLFTSHVKGLFFRPRIETVTVESEYDNEKKV